MSIVSSVRAVIADTLRSHIKSARTKNTYFNWVVEKISPQMRFWPADQVAQYPKGKNLDDWDIAPTAPKRSVFHKKSPLEKAGIWKAQYLKRFKGAHVYDSTLVNEAIEQINKGKPLRALLLIQHSMDRTDISTKLVNTAADGRVGHGRDEKKHSQNVKTEEDELKKHRDELRFIASSSDHYANYSSATIDDSLEAIELAFNRAMEEIN
ncbi:hypothetical protein [Parendozoicomonas sp. Alg238-R29]|uniref:hypothetical protein n=1 Tax=Parendozoicomonas sp. Alg238-R29 TaxID=2993446 RepID=UPI00248F397D|nr:hypothetical protein [Parendozoicomonas sp. Alg238-R29]